MRRFPCPTCGDWVHSVDLSFSGECPKCMEPLFKEKSVKRTNDRRKEGIIPKSRTMRGRKGYNSRLVNLFFNDKAEFDRLFAGLKKREPRRAGWIMRMVRERQKYNKEVLVQVAQELFLKSGEK